MSLKSAPEIKHFLFITFSCGAYFKDIARPAQPNHREFCISSQEQSEKLSDLFVFLFAYYNK